jgi:hypothetical protein
MALLLAACSGAATAAGDEAQAGEPGLTDGQVVTPAAIQARIVVSRTAQPGDPSVVEASGQTAEAIAQFAAIEQGGMETLVAAGLAPISLKPGQCLRPSDNAAGSFSELGAIELLDVGEVTLAPRSTPLAASATDPRATDPRATDPRATDAQALEHAAATPVGVSLAPHAFPSVSSFISGVVYTSRDRASAALPSGVGYEISISGSAELPAFRLLAEAPRQLTQVTVGGEPLLTLSEVNTQSPLDLTWGVGQAGDLVVVELQANAESSSVVRCAFADEVGAGSIPMEWLPSVEGAGQVTLHRQRTQQTVRTPQAERAQLIAVSFDFETNRAIEFVK